MSNLRLLLTVAAVAVTALFVPGAQPVQALYYTSSCVNVPANCFSTADCVATVTQQISSYPYTCCATGNGGCTGYQGIDTKFVCSYNCPSTHTGSAVPVDDLKILGKGGDCPNCR